MFRPLYLIILFLLPSLSLAQVDPASVTIMRDAYGVPHIYAPTDAAAAYGLAWAHAEDNFYDIQQNLMISRARLAEVEGKEGAVIDYAVQLLRVRPLVEARYDTDVSPEFKKVLEASCQAMNTFAEQNPDDVRLDGLFPVEPTDVLVGYQMIMGLMSGVAGHLQNIVEGYPNAPTAYSQDGKGSNAFAFNSRKTDDGSVCIVNNTHQPLEGPFAWYEAHVNSDEGWNCLGGMFPGGISIFTGANPNLAWAHTVNMGDFVDVYELEMDPKDPMRYRFDGSWKRLREYKAHMKVKVGPIKLKVKKKYWWSVYGATMKGKDGKFYSVRLSANMGIGAAEQWWRMNKARNFSEFYKTLNRGGLGCFNIVYADRNDTIMYIDNGNYPFRERGYDWLKVLPGDTSATLWSDFHSTEELVQVLQPSCGYVYNCNNTPFSSSGPLDTPQRRDYDPTLGVCPNETNRSIRFRELIAEYDRVSYADIKRIKYDRSFPKQFFTPFMSNPDLMVGLDPNQFPEVAEEIERLKAWDREAREDSEDAGLFLVFLDNLIQTAQDRQELFVMREWSPEEVAAELIKAKKHLKKHFGSTQVPLGKIQRLVRGDFDFPAPGMRDVLAALTSAPWEKGRYKANNGDSYIQFARFTEQGIQLESVINFGSSTDPASPHYVDQAEMYLSQQTKPMSLEREWVEKHAVRTYHPGE